MRILVCRGGYALRSTLPVPIVPMLLRNTEICCPHRVAGVAFRVALALASTLFATQAVLAQDADALPTVESYRIAGAADEAKIKQLVDQLTGKTQFRQIYDRPAGQWVVVATPAIHALITEQLQPIDQLRSIDPKQVATPPPERQAQAPTEPLDVGPRDTQQLQLRTLTAETLHARLEKVFGHPLSAERDRTKEWLTFSLNEATGNSITIQANSRSRQVLIDGPALQTKSWRKIIETLDFPPTAAQASVLVATKPDSAVPVRQVVGVLGKARLVAQTTAAGEQAAPDPATDSTAPATSLLGPVQIETVEGTDTLLLRGNPRDVERVLQVIKEIEQMSETSEPQVEVVNLSHVDSVSIAALLSQIFSESLTSSVGYGSLSVLPLVKPNAVLLIGTPTTIEKAKQVLKQLDVPSKTLTQFETFSLKYARANDAKQIVESLFSGESAEDVNTLEPKAQVIADPRTNALIVRAGPRDMAEVRALVQEIDRVGSESINELRIFKLKNTVADDLASVLRDAIQGNADDSENENLSRLLKLVTIDEEGQRQLESGVLAGANIAASNSANALIVTAPTESMPLLEALIDQLDQTPDAAIELKIFPLENGDAVSLVDTLSELFSTGDNSEDSSEITRLRVEVDERTNSILAAGTRDDLVTVEAILRTLDSTDARDRQNRVYRLKNKSALDVAQALNDWLRAERDVQGTAPGTASPFQQIEREVVVVPELASNSLIVSATPRYYEEVSRLIHDLDAQDAMVMIQVLIAEIELSDIDEFGVELGLQDSLLFDRSLLGDLETTTTTVISQDVGGSNTVSQDVIQSATNTPGFNFGNPATALGNAGSTSSLATAGNVAGQVLSSFGVQRVSSDAGFGGLVLSASSNSISMLLRALQESSRLEVLSRPQIMAMDNQTGAAFVGQIVPFITESTPNQLTGQLINSVERVNVGLTLEVTPRISPDGLVVMTVYAENKRLRPLSEGVPVGVSANGTPLLQPIQEAIQASTTVSAVSGQTVVLSGLITKQDTALHRRVPILADVPLLGDLFRFDSVSTQRRELLIVLTPHVVRSRFESEMLKQVESARMNWCLSDVVDLHGPAGLRSQSDRAGAAEAEIVFPQPVSPEEYLPEQRDAPQTESMPSPQHLGPRSPTSPENFPSMPLDLPAPQ